MEADIAYFVTYPCPQCRLELESEHGGWPGWLRCPACDTPSLPPDILFGHPATSRRVRGAGGKGEAMLFIGDDDPDGDTASNPSDLIGPPPSPVASGLRLVFLSGLMISLFILLIAYLDDNQFIGGVFGGLSFVFFLLLLRAPSRRRRRYD